MRSATALAEPEIFEAVDCLLCRGHRSSAFISAQDDLTGRPGHFTFVRCERCGLSLSRLA